MIKKITLTITLLIGSLLVIKAQTTAIPDANFENKLIALGIDTNGATGDILNADALAVTNLNVSNSNITDFTGIEAFTNLTHLYCQSNFNVTTFNIDNLVNLEYLFCRAMGLETLNLSQNINLQELYCGSNALQSIDLSNNLALTVLYCSSNDLQTLDLSHNTQLVDLSCEWNTQLQALDLSNNTLLETIYCETIAIQELDLSANTALKLLVCAATNIQSLDLSSNTDLEELNCVNNPQLQSLDLRNGNYENITSLSAGSNPNLSCVYVDDVTYFTTNWPNAIDATATYAENETACSVTAVNSLDDDRFSVYPNPASNNLYITTDYTLDKIIIFDSLGSKVIHTIPYNKQINIESLKTGVYLLKIFSGNKSVFKKFIKN